MHAKTNSPRPALSGVLRPERWYVKFKQALFNTTAWNRRWVTVLRPPGTCNLAPKGIQSNRRGRVGVLELWQLTNRWIGQCVQVRTPPGQCQQLKKPGKCRPFRRPWRMGLCGLFQVAWLSHYGHGYWGKLGAYRPGWVLEERALEGTLEERGRLMKELWADISWDSGDA